MNAKDIDWDKVVEVVLEELDHNIWKDLYRNNDSYDTEYVLKIRRRLAIKARDNIRTQIRDNGKNIIKIGSEPKLVLEKGEPDAT